MLTIKNSEDFIKMSKAGKVVSNIHYEIYESTKPGIKLKELDDIAKEIIEKSNVKSSFFDSIALIFVKAVFFDFSRFR